MNSLDGLKWIMRYNDWQNDPLSLGNAGNAISSRFDLVSGSGKSAFGGIDTKVTSYKEFQSLKVSTHQYPVVAILEATMVLIQHRTLFGVISWWRVLLKTPLVVSITDIPFSVT